MFTVTRKEFMAMVKETYRDIEHTIIWKDSFTDAVEAGDKKTINATIDGWVSDLTRLKVVLENVDFSAPADIED